MLKIEISTISFNYSDGLQYYVAEILKCVLRCVCVYSLL